MTQSSMLPVILASGSRQRRALMDTLGVSYTIVPSAFDERSIIEADPRKRVQVLASHKGQAVHSKNPAAIIIAADSVVWCDGQLLEKPESIEQAREMLTWQSGKLLTVYTAVWYSDPRRQPVLEVVEPRAKFIRLSDKMIDYYCAHNAVTDWAGGYSPAYAAGACLIDWVDGSLSGFCHGLPMEIVIPLLQQSGAL